MKIVHTATGEHLKGIKERKDGNRLIGIRTDEMLENGESMKEFGLFNDYNHTFIEVEKNETISVRTPNGKIMTFCIMEHGTWANVDIKVFNENVDTKALAFEDGKSKIISGNLYAIDMSEKK